MLDADCFEAVLPLLGGDPVSGRGPWGIRVLVYAFLAAFSLLVGEMARLQLILGEDLAARSRDQRMEQVAVIPTRGAILDRNWRVLAGGSNRRNAIIVLPRLVRNRAVAARTLSVLLGISEEKALSRLDSPVPLHVVTTSPALERALAEIPGDPGVVIVEEAARYSPDGLAVHAIGYADSTGMRGVSGIEKFLDAYLRGGQPGLVAVFVDGRRRIVPGLGIREVSAESRGADVRLTIDRDIQAVVERVMDERVERGAVVVMDPQTGDILALASRPDFAPDDIGAFLEKAHSPLVNRAIMAYPLGSVFKVAVAAAAIERRVVSLHEILFDPGYIDVGTRRFKCYKYDEGGHGAISFLDGMAYSCNAVFVEVGLRVGGEALARFAESLGFGATTGVGLPAEDAGALPDPRSLAAQDVANLSIGQGCLSGSPLQVAVMMSTIASGGWLRRPRLVMEISSESSGQTRVFTQPAPVRVLSPDTCRQVAFMLEAVTRWGTGTAAWVEDVGSCGKTGSAETGRLGEAGQPICHAWFAGFTPLTHPRLVIVVFIEEGMSGGKAAAPVFAEIARGTLPLLPPDH